jgi:hypothetical protein
MLTHYQRRLCRAEMEVPLANRISVWDQLDAILATQEKLHGNKRDDDLSGWAEYVMMVDLAIHY